MIELCIACQNKGYWEYMSPNMDWNVEIMTWGFYELCYPAKRIKCQSCNGLGYILTNKACYNLSFSDGIMYYLIKYRKGVAQTKFRISYQENGEKIRHVAEMLDYREEEALAMVRGLNMFLLSIDSSVGGFENAPIFEER